jgi:hypothetical protein
VGYTVFQNCDLSEAEGLDEVRHDAPSTVGVDTLYRSRGRIPAQFLLGIGAPEGLFPFQQAIANDSPLGGEFFIACAEKDIPFAQQLQSALRAHGVRTWVFAENFRGNALVDRRSTSEEEEIERWIRHYDKLIVVCSQAGLDSETVRNDLTAAKDLQQSKDQWLVYVVDPDGTLHQPRARAARNLTYDHVIFDLKEHSANSAAYQQVLARLAEALKQSNPAKAGVPTVSDQL